MRPGCGGRGFREARASANRRAAADAARHGLQIVWPNLAANVSHRALWDISSLITHNHNSTIGMLVDAVTSFATPRQQFEAQLKQPFLNALRLHAWTVASSAVSESRPWPFKSAKTRLRFASASSRESPMACAAGMVTASAYHDSSSCQTFAGMSTARFCHSHTKHLCRASGANGTCMIECPLGQSSRPKRRLVYRRWPHACFVS